jgi:hypothetical protein
MYGSRNIAMSYAENTVLKYAEQNPMAKWIELQGISFWAIIRNINNMYVNGVYRQYRPYVNINGVYSSSCIG